MQSITLNGGPCDGRYVPESAIEGDYVILRSPPEYTWARGMHWCVRYKRVAPRQAMFAG